MIGIVLALAATLVVPEQKREQPVASETILRATCKVNINAGTPHRSYGTGTFVVTPERVRRLLHENEVLVISAGHVVEGITIRGSISVTLPLLAPSATTAHSWGETYPARCLDFITSGSDGDVALVAVAIPKGVAATQVHLAPLAPETIPSLNEEFFAVGCRGGELPKIERARALHYVEPGDAKACPILHAAVLRRPGDSGGGLFDSSGRLYAVCSGCEANAEIDVGPGLTGFNTNTLPARYRGPSSSFYPGWVVLKLPIVVGDGAKTTR
jgi:hypothetical protein